MLSTRDKTIMIILCIMIVCIIFISIYNHEDNKARTFFTTYTIIHKTCSGKLQNTYKGCSNIEPIGQGFKLTKNDGLETMIFGGLTVMNEEDPNIISTTIEVDEGNK